MQPHDLLPSSEAGDLLRVAEPESSLIARAKSGDGEAFSALYQRYAPQIQRYIASRLGDPVLAEDICADVFVKVLESLGRYEDRGWPFSAWLYRIAHNLVANWHRDRSRRKVVSLEDVTTAGSRGKTPDAHVEEDERRTALVAAIRRLPLDRQQLISLKFVEDLPNAEIGEMMGRTEGAIKSLYRRTLIALREDLAARGFNW